MKKWIVLSSLCFLMFGLLDLFLAVLGFDILTAQARHDIIYSFGLYSEFLFIFGIIPNFLTSYGLIKKKKFVSITGLLAVPMNLIFTIGWFIAAGFLGVTYLTLPDPIAYAWLFLPFVLFSISSSVLLRNYGKTMR